MGRSSKRRRKAREKEDQKASNNDGNEWFDDDETKAQYLTTHPGELKSSWLGEDVKWLTTFSDDMATEAEHDDATLRQKGIQKLSHDLLEAKRKLWPAVEQCTEAIRKLRIPSSKKHKQRHRRQCATTISEQQVFCQAREACNPYEILGQKERHGGLNVDFVNRSAMKLANMNAMLQFQLTATRKDPQLSDNDDNNSFVFVDLCGAPGGFSEYLLHRCQKKNCAVCQCRGYGMSLRGGNEQGRGTPWRIMQEEDDSQSVKSGCRCVYRICDGEDGTGDVFEWKNVQALQAMMKSDARASSGKGSGGSLRAHLVVADGGCDAQRNSDCQEELAQKLVVCQVAAALTLLQKGGIMVVKMFGSQSVTIRTLLEELHFIFFDRMTALKPVSSRPASAERYLVCTRFRGLPSDEWDGRQWRDNLLQNSPSRSEEGMHGNAMKQKSTSPNGTRKNKEVQRVAAYFDEFDRDMLDLNLKACSNILSYLESKSTSSPPGSFRALLSGIDTEAYKHAWQLH